MIAHGAQKVLGSFNGPGFKTFIANSTPFSFMRPTWLWLGAAALSELVGGLLVAFGLLTRVGAFLIGCVMLTAIVGVHWPGGFFAAKLAPSPSLRPFGGRSLSKRAQRRASAAPHIGRA